MFSECGSKILVLSSECRAKIVELTLNVELKSFNILYLKNKYIVYIINIRSAQRKKCKI